MASSCKNLKEELVACLKISPCMAERGKTFHECLKSRDEAELGECQKVRRGYFECKRGQLDMRKRFKGNVDFIRKSPNQPPPEIGESNHKAMDEVADMQTPSPLLSRWKS